MNINECMRSLRAISDERTEYRKPVPGEQRRCRNRFTNERGITYLKTVSKYRVFAHRPFYCFVGTYHDLTLAVQARDHAEAINLAKLYAVAPELEDIETQDAVQIKRHNRTLYSIVYVVDGGTFAADCASYDECLSWLANTRQAFNRK